MDDLRDMAKRMNIEYNMKTTRRQLTARIRYKIRSQKTRKRVLILLSIVTAIVGIAVIVGVRERRKNELLKRERRRAEIKRAEKMRQQQRVFVSEESAKAARGIQKRRTVRKSQFRQAHLAQKLADAEIKQISDPQNEELKDDVIMYTNLLEHARGIRDAAERDWQATEMQERFNQDIALGSEMMKARKEIRGGQKVKDRIQALGGQKAILNSRVFKIQPGGKFHIQGLGFEAGRLRAILCRDLDKARGTATLRRFASEDLQVTGAGRMTKRQLCDAITAFISEDPKPLQ